MAIYENALYWQYTNRIYENHLFFRLCLIALFFAICPFCLGFELDALTIYQNLALNFLVFLGLCGLLTLILWLFFILYEKPKGEQYLDDLTIRIQNNLKPDEQKQVWELLKTGGYLLPNHTQRKAVIWLCVIALFELFLLSAWVKNGTLIWQPTWVLVIINWVETHTSWVTVVHGGKFFGFFAMFDRDDLVYQYYQTPQAFLSSELGKTAMFVSFIQLMSYYPKILLMKNAFGEMAGWLGINRIIHKMNGGILGFIWGTAMMLATFLFFFAILFVLVGLLTGDEKIAMITSGNINWLGYVIFSSFYGLFVMWWYILFLAWLKVIFKVLKRVYYMFYDE